jgi:hypothetical protein
MPCIGNVPSIVANGSIQWTGASHAATTIFTPTVTGTYRVSLYLSPEPNGSYPSGSPSESITLSWTDPTAARSITANAYTLDGAGITINSTENLTALDLVLAATTSAIQVSSAGGSSMVTYDLYYVVEQLA